MNAIGVQDGKGPPRDWDWDATSPSMMAYVNGETDIKKRCAFEEKTVPLLQKISSVSRQEIRTL